MKMTGIMKKYITFAGMLLLAGLFPACEYGILDQVPNDRIDLEGFYANQNDAEIGLTGAYSRIISKETMANIFWCIISADEMTAAAHATAGIGSGDHRDLTTSAMWGMDGPYMEPYKGIANLNLLLERVPQASEEGFQGNRRNEILGEAHFLRGFAYWFHAMIYRDIPLITEVPTSSNPDDNILPKSDQSLILDQALKDFEEAITLLPDRLEDMSDHDVRGRASKWAALGYKARIHMWRDEWSQAYNACQQIIEGNQFVLTEKWTDIFYSEMGGNNDNEEVIWQSQGQSRAQYDFIGVYRWFCDTDPDAPTPQFRVEPGMLNMFEKPFADVRYEYSLRRHMTEDFNPSLSGARNVKHFHVPSGLIVEGVSDESRDKNFPFMRLAEILLMKAEALVQSGYSLGSQQDVLNILNALRARAADPDFMPREGGIPEGYQGCTGIEALTIDQVNLQAVKDEKRRELMCEGIRWIDLLRWGKEDNYAYIMDICNAANPDRLYQPIIQSQINVSKGILVQNPGY
jgi:hypothetical protein